MRPRCERVRVLSKKSDLLVEGLPAAGTFAARGALDPSVLFVLLAIAAVAGDTVNYRVGRYLGPRAQHGLRFVKQEHLDRTHAFFERHGGKTIEIARFVPIIRTFAPFVAGVGAMNYPRFLMFNVGGGVLWIGLLVYAGYQASVIYARWSIYSTYGAHRGQRL